MMSLLAAAALAAAGPAPAEQPTVVLVHGATMDGSSWRKVYDRLRRRGSRVTVVQLPLTGFDDDLAATQTAIAHASGPVVLVGHSYGGAIISVAGADKKVRALVYVAAFQPERGESVADLGARFPMAAHPLMVSDHEMIVDPGSFAADVAADLNEADAEFLASSQRPTAVAAFAAKLPVAAWHEKPTWAILAKADRTLSPELARFMYSRSSARLKELDASHLVHVSRPDEVAAVIQEAATFASR